MSYPLCSSGGVKNKNPNPDHNIWNNNGTYWCHYTVHNEDYTKKRVRVSLGTKDIAIARALRDFLMDATPKIATNIPRTRGQAMPDCSSGSRLPSPCSLLPASEIQGWSYDALGD